MNKKGNSLTGWIQGLMFMVLFVGVFSVAMIAEMNTLHSGNKTVELGTEDLESSFKTFQESASDKVADGKISITDLGAFLFKDSWTVLIGGFTFILNFLFGGWIQTIVLNWLQLPDKVATMLQGLWIVSIVFIIISIIFKRNT